LEDGSLVAILPNTVLLFGTLQLPPPVTTNSVTSHEAVALIVVLVLVTTRNCGVNPGARVELASLIVTPLPISSA
jgi:hypothetical protein